MAIVGKLTVVLSAKTKRFISDLQNVEHSMMGVQMSMMGVTDAAAKVTMAFGAATAASVYLAAKLEKDLTRAAAVAGSELSTIETMLGGITEANTATAKELLNTSFGEAYSQMAAAASQMAADTVFSAEEVIGGMERLAMAGSNAKSAIAAMPSVLQLSSASGLELADSANAITNVMAGFGITIASVTDELEKQRGVFPDISDVIETMNRRLKKTNNTLVGVFTGSNTSMLEMTAAMRMAGPTAVGMGIKIEELAASIGVLGNAGIIGSEAGTGLKKIMSSIAGASGKGKKALAAFGIESRDLAGKGGLTAIVEQLGIAKKKFEEAGKTTEFTGLLFQAFGERAGPKMAALLNQGAQSIANLKKRAELANKLDLASFLEAKQVDTFAGAMKLLQSKLSEVIASIGKGLLPILRPVIVAFSDLAAWVIDLSPAVKQMIGMFVMFTAAAGATVLVLSVLIGLVAGVIAAVAGIITAVKSAAFVTFFASVLPVVIIVAAAIGLIISMIGLMGYAFGDELAAMNSDAQGYGDSISDALISAVKTAIGMTLTLIWSGVMAVGFFLRAIAGVVAAAATMIGFVVDLIYNFMVKPLKVVFNELIISLLGGVNYLVDSFPSLAEKLGISETTDAIAEMRKELEKPFKAEFSATKGAIDIAGKIDESIKAYTIQDDLSPTALYDQMASALGKSGEGLGNIAKAVAGQSGNDKNAKKFDKLLKEMKAKIDSLTNRKVNTDLSPEGEGTGKVKAAAAVDFSMLLGDYKSLTDIIVAEMNAREKALAAFPDLVGIRQKFASEMEKVFKLSGNGKDKEGLRLASELKKEKFTRTLADFLASIEKESDLPKAMKAVAKQADEMGISFEKVVEKAGDLSFGFDKTKADAGKSIQDVVSRFAFDNLAPSATSKGSLKSFTDLLGSEAQGAIGGSGLNMGAIVGGAIGSAFPVVGTAIGSAVGTAVFDILEKIPQAILDGFYAVGDFITTLIPESRLQSAGEDTVNQLGSFLAAAMAFTAAVVTFPALMPAVVFLGAALAGLAALTWQVTLPLLALAASVAGLLFIFNLAMQSDAIKDFQGALTSAVDMLMELFDPLSEVLMPLAGLFLAALGLLKPFIESFVAGLVESKSAIFDVAKGFLLAGAGFTMVIANVSNAVITFFQMQVMPFLLLADVVIAVSGFFSDLALSMLGLMEWIGRLTSNPQMISSAAQGRAEISGITSQAQEIRDGLAGIVETLESFKINTDDVQAAIDAVAAITEEQADIAGTALVNLRESNNGMSEALLNAPEGFKLARYRLESIIEGIGNSGATGEASSATGDRVFNIEQIFVVASDSDEFISAVQGEAERRVQEQTGGIFAEQNRIGGSF